MIKNNKTKHLYKKTATEALKERKIQILDSLNPSVMENIIRSSLITRFVKCGKSNCRCANGEGHKNFYLSSYYRGHTFIDYVPKSYEERLANCTRGYEEVNALLVELSEINLELFRRKELEL